MYRGRIRFEVPMMWTVGFMVTFVIGGMTGVLLAVPPADFVLHNSLFLIAHFHNVIIGGVVFGLFAGINYWFPKAFGYKLDPFWGKCSFWFWLVGFYVAFMPLYVLGLMGVTRRMSHFDDPSLQIWFADRGLRRRADRAGHRLAFLDPARGELPAPREAARRHRRPVGRPHAGMVDLVAAAGLQLRLHAASSTTTTPGADMKKRGYERPLDGFMPIHMPKNTGAGFVLAGLSRRVRLRADLAHVAAGRRWPSSALLVAAIVHTFNYKRDFYIPADEVVRTEDRAHPHCWPAMSDMTATTAPPRAGAGRRASI